MRYTREDGCRAWLTYGYIPCDVLGKILADYGCAEAVYDDFLRTKGHAFDDYVPKKNIDELLKQVMPQDLVKFGLIPEFIGRVPVVQSLEQLGEDALVRILTEPRNAITKQYQKLFELDGVELKFEADAVKEIASQALERKTGARGLRSIIEKAMLNVMYQVPSDETIGSVIITKESVLGEGEPKYIYREDEVVEKNTRRRVRSHRNEIA